MNAYSVAERATMQSFMNCFLREAKAVDRALYDEKELIISLQHQQVKLFIPIKYWSKTGRHLFDFPAFYQLSEQGEKLELDFNTLVSLVSKELSHQFQSNKENQVELIARVIQSYQLIVQIIEERFEDQGELYDEDFTFIEAEQSLIFGHLLHPTPKSRQGFSEEDIEHYSPELKGSFALHYFRVPLSLIKESSTLEKNANQLIKDMVLEDPFIGEDFKHFYAKEDEYALIPLHPWQAQYVKKNPYINKLITENVIEDLGQAGRPFFPTSSLRTVYHPEVPFMFKFSLNIKITNSVRANLLKELERGVEVTKLMEGNLGGEIEQRFSNFSIVTDPAYITLNLKGMKETGFEVILRENPFMNEAASKVTPIAALCQDKIEGRGSRLSSIIHGIAEQENKSVTEISEAWFEQYLDISFEPMMWLYLQRGIALEAHQQNSVVSLTDEGYPKHFYYRDNQGYYYCESKKEELKKLLPNISTKSETICADRVADERLRYYLFYNHLFGIINAFGTGNLIEEEKLLVILKNRLSKISINKNHPSNLVNSLLNDEEIACKANLLTRFHDMDELVGAMETQSVYVPIKNPLIIR
ncbi:IucA/IucC family protein [Bacillus carboniphilus]|uniref:IucA/IucC family protein n=1 Tax=Bacillus carboniphilus TaxID=86663 RepID=A0ABY9JUQ9_9BACI|nr:IucA/IucC family protein [Bacillus carboniphilus]WLR43136.1 IucA/IucC family protein [Bacillus carboniphilus]